MAPKEKEVKQLSSYKSDPRDFSFRDTPFREIRFSPNLADNFALLFHYGPKIIEQCLWFIATKELDPGDVDLYVDFADGKLFATGANLVQPNSFSISIGPGNYEEFKSSVRFGIKEETTRNTTLDDAEALKRQMPGQPGMRGPYRKANQLPDPSKPPDAEINRTKQQLKLRLPPSLIAEVEEAAEDANVSRNEWLERAIQTALKRTP